jgi:dTDP-4-dehydrorhamnose 3,5-epimerase
MTMKATELAIAGAWVFEPRVFPDDRGRFAAPYQADAFREALGFELHVAQVNQSVSARGVIRGVHFADVPPGQAKYVACTRGAVLDVIVDIRVGSPTYGQWDSVRLDDVDRRSVYVAEGLGHGFCALTDDATLTYLCSATYSPTGERAIHPLDPELGISWPAEAPQLSPRDLAAPSLADARRDGFLPDYATCREYTHSLRTD